MNYEMISDPVYWRNLIPHLKLSSAEETHSILPLEIEFSEKVVSQLVEEGYFHFDEVIPKDSINNLKEGILTLRKHSFLPLFAFIYDDFWEIFLGLKNSLQSVLGEEVRMLPDFWIWYVDPSKEESGWSPHRDKISKDPLFSDGMPKSLTIWIPITDATPLNGCMYYIPANLDKSYRDIQDRKLPTDLQLVRALPAKAGSVLGWNQRILHWGGRSSKYAAEPRISMALEFQRSDIPAYNHPLLEMNKLPPFKQRLELIGKQILQYTHMYNYSEEMVNLAKKMVGLPQNSTHGSLPNTQKISRNAPCPCGSGKKYKHCHGSL